MRALLLLILCLVTPLFAAPASAMNADEREHARSAFLFAGRKDWNNAILHANKTGEPVLATLINWQYLLDADSGAGFDEIRLFTTEHPDWPEQKKLRVRGEMAFENSGVLPEEIIEWFSASAPLTGVGKIALARVLAKSGKQPKEMIASLVREAWRDGDFDEAQEQALLADYRNILRAQDDVARLDRLLWEAKTTQAERMIARISPGQQTLARARIALQADKKDAPKLAAAVPAAFRYDAGLLYDRMRYRARKDDDAGVRALLVTAPKKVPFPEKWWKLREPQVRAAIDEGNIPLAASLLANHGQQEGQGFAEAVWLSGWVALQQNRPQDAYQAFYSMFNAVKYPVSKSRAAYWAARAQAKAGDAASAQQWYATAGSYPTTFYGQLALAKSDPQAALHIPAPPAISDNVRAQFEARDVVKAVRLCVEFGDTDVAGKLINHLVETAASEPEAALAGELGASAGKTYLSVRAAKKALQNNVVLIAAGYPTPKTPDGLDIERALTLAITRQESEFDPHAESPSGARGMMQLLSSTAKEIARKNDMGFAEDRLWEPDYNMTLGSQYLARLIESYDGSYVMGIAAYNAGPGNVRKWVQNFGTPGNTVDGAVEWMEKIPFSETRNYVQRVLENIQVYRHIEAGDAAPKLQLGDDLMR